MSDFTVTDCSVSRPILTFEDTIDIRLTVRNTSGIKLTKCGLNLYTKTDADTTARRRVPPARGHTDNGCATSA